MACMDNRNPDPPERIKVGGIKLSPELVQFTCSYPPDRRVRFNSFLSHLADRQINIFFLSHDADSGTTTTTLCVEKEQHLVVEKHIQHLVAHKGDLTCKDSVGTLTVFPHRRSLSFLSEILNAFYSNGLALYGLCTSISALSVITDFSELDKAAIHLQRIVELPENHAPFRQEFCIKQLGH